MSDAFAPQSSFTSEGRMRLASLEVMSLLISAVSRMWAMPTMLSPPNCVSMSESSGCAFLACSNSLPLFGVAVAALFLFFSSNVALLSACWVAVVSVAMVSLLPTSAASSCAK